MRCRRRLRGGSRGRGSFPRGALGDAVFVVGFAVRRGFSPPACEAEKKCARGRPAADKLSLWMGNVLYHRRNGSERPRHFTKVSHVSCRTWRYRKKRNTARGQARPRARDNSQVIVIVRWCRPLLRDQQKGNADSASARGGHSSSPHHHHNKGNISTSGASKPGEGVSYPVAEGPQRLQQPRRPLP